jgi:2-oxoglutarate dehydrogenase N-terminus
MKLLVASSQRRLLARWSRNAPSSSSLVRRSLLSTKVQEAETFLNGTSSLYAEQLYEQYQQDPASVHESWKQYFDGVEAGSAFDAGDYSRPTSIPGKWAMAATVVRCICIRWELFRGQFSQPAFASFVPVFPFG